MHATIIWMQRNSLPPSIVSPRLGIDRDPIWKQKTVTEASASPHKDRTMLLHGIQESHRDLLRSNLVHLVSTFFSFLPSWCQLSICVAISLLVRQ